MIFTIVFPANAFGVISKDDYAGHWAEDTIQSWLDKSYVTGYPDGSFIPEGYVTRVEFVKMVNKAFDYTEICDISFTDVESDAWYYQDVQKAYKAGYIAGFSETQFAPNDKLTREQAAVIISRILKLEGYISGIDKFEDKNDISSYAIEGVGAAAKAEFIKGYDTDNTFKPKNPIKRAEAVSILDRAMTVDDQTNDLTIEDAGTVIENQTFNNVHITEKVGNGEVTLKNVTITGELLVEGGGLNSIILENSTINELTTNKEDGKVRILITGNTAVDATNILSGATLEQQNLTGTGFIQVTVDKNVEENQTLTVSANIGNLTVEAKVKVNLKTGNIEKMTLEKASEGISVNLADDANVLLVIIYARASFAGKGEISKTIINANEVVFEQKPKEVEVADGFSIPKIIPLTSGKSSNSGNNDTVDIPVTSVSINYSNITMEVGNTVELKAIIEPSNATIKNVIWTSSNTTVAAISSEGNLLSKTTGSAIITATTVDGNKTANCDVIVKDSITWEYVINEDNTLTITKYLGNQEIAKIPNSISGKQVTRIEGYEYNIIKDITIPSSVEYVDTSIFYRGLIENINVDINNRFYKSIDGVLFNKNMDTLISYPMGNSRTAYSLPDGVNTIALNAFATTIYNEPAPLSEIYIPSSVNSIEDIRSLEARLSNIYVDDENTVYKSIDGVLFNKSGDELLCYPYANERIKYSVPEGTKIISEGFHSTFGIPHNLTVLRLPSSIETLPILGFKIDNLENIYVDLNNKSFASVEGVVFSKDLNTLIAYPKGNSRNSYSIPFGVTKVNDGAFQDGSNGNLKNITIPATLVDVGSVLRVYLENIFVDENHSSLKSISGVLFSKDGKTLIRYPRLRQDTKYIIPTGTEKLDYSAFFNCNLSTLIIPYSVTLIESSSIEWCSLLEDVLIYNNKVNIMNNNFQGCKEVMIWSGEGSTSSIFAEINNIPFALLSNYVY
jgi:uncharacterized protein YjdB